MTMIAVIKTQSGNETTVELEQGAYGNGRIAIVANDTADGDRYGSLTVNLPEAKLGDDEILVKTWSENSHWVPQVLNQLPKVFQDTGRRVIAGYTTASVWKYTPDAKAKDEFIVRSAGLASPVVKLSTGINVANFSSPHPFTFDDGTVLPACSGEHAKALMLESKELEAANERWTDIKLSFSMSSAVRFWLDELDNAITVDIVLVPFPVMEALKQSGLPVGKCRVVRVADRVTKTIHHDRFCV